MVDPFKEKVIEMLESGLSGVRIHGELVKEFFSTPSVMSSLK